MPTPRRSLRTIRWVAAAALVLVCTAAPARGRPAETIHDYRVSIEILADGTIRVTELIDYDFGGQRRHGIFRTIPTRAWFDDTRDRIYPLGVESVTVSGGAPADVEVTEEGVNTVLRVGDPDVEVSGRHSYALVYTVEGALNAFRDHDELYWNAVGHGWEAPIARARVSVSTPGPVTRATCYQGYVGAVEPCEAQTFTGGSTGGEARFSAGRTLQPFEGLTIVVAMPKGSVPDPSPILDERWSARRAFGVTPGRVAATAAIAAVAAGLAAGQWWRSGRDRRYVGSPVDQVLGTATGEHESVPWGEGDEEAPVEFSPPDRLHPGQMGVLLDERPRTLHITATIVDLAVRGFLTIEEIEKRGLFGKPDWILRRSAALDDDLPPYERKLLGALFRKGNEVTVSELRNTFATRLQEVKASLLASAVKRKWFAESPDRVRTRWIVRGVLVIVAGGVVTVALALWTSWALVGLAVVFAGILQVVVAGAMPARTAAGTALVRRIRGFRRVMAKAETHTARWAEEEHVFTRYLPYAIVFGLVEKWAKAFADMGFTDETPTWYRGAHPFTHAAFADSVDSFAVATGGTLASTPASSGSSGFGGGGSSGGGGGGGGGGSW